MYPGMPTGAMVAVDVDGVAAATGLAEAVTKAVLATLPADAPPVWPELAKETDVSEVEETEAPTEDRPGTPSACGCPDCGGVVWELDEGELLRFRCRVGHGWTAESLLQQESSSIEGALSVALWALEEQVSLAERLVQRARARNLSVAHRFERQREEAEQQASLIRDLLRQQLPPMPTEMA